METGRLRGSSNEQKARERISVLRKATVLSGLEKEKDNGKTKSSLVRRSCGGVREKKQAKGWKRTSGMVIGRRGKINRKGVSIL